MIILISPCIIYILKTDIENRDFENFSACIKQENFAKSLGDKQVVIILTFNICDEMFSINSGSLNILSILDTALCMTYIQT